VVSSEEAFAQKISRPSRRVETAVIREPDVIPIISENVFPRQWVESTFRTETRHFPHSEIIKGRINVIPIRGPSLTSRTPKKAGPFA